jgi:plasmid stabilization system protein ParE
MSRRAIAWTKRASWRLDQIGGQIAKDNPDAVARVIARFSRTGDRGRRYAARALSIIAMKRANK